MAGGNVHFVAFKTVAKPASVKFKTKTGRTVSFKALKTVKKKVLIRFRAKRRK